MVRTASSTRASRGKIGQQWRKLFRLIPDYDPIATAAEGDWFDAAAAQTALDFFSECLQFVEGDKAGEPFVLEEWQKAIVACLFGWKREDGTRRYREALVYVPRKNGKTPLAAGIVLYGLFCDGEEGAQIYSAAAEREQAALVYRHAQSMIVREPELQKRAKVYKTFKSIEYPAKNSVYKALSADADTKHGFNSHLVIVDELHAHPNGELVDVLTTSMASRTQPLLIHITTADYDRESVCNQKHDYATRIRDGVIDDPSFLPVIFEASKDDDWTDPKVWEKANPNLGVSVNRDYLERECQRAQDQPVYENTFKRLHLNIRTEQDVRWLSLAKWDACEFPVDEGALAGRECFGGLDLSTKVDITAWVLVFPPVREGERWAILPRFWVPGVSAHEREKRDRVPYTAWAKDDTTGLRLTEGNVVDYEAVAAQILEDSERFQIREIAYDPWNATHMALNLQDQGAEMVEFRQGYPSMSEPTKEFEKLILAQGIAHGGNPVLRWMASNVAVDIDPAGNYKPSKKKSVERIDGIVATIMGVGRAMVAGDEAEEPGMAIA